MPHRVASPQLEAEEPLFLRGGGGHQPPPQQTGKNWSQTNMKVTAQQHRGTSSTVMHWSITAPARQQCSSTAHRHDVFAGSQPQSQAGKVLSSRGMEPRWRQCIGQPEGLQQCPAHVCWESALPLHWIVGTMVKLLGSARGGLHSSPLPESSPHPGLLFRPGNRSATILFSLQKCPWRQVATFHSYSAYNPIGY